MKLSLIIPTYNREEVLVECLKTALRQEEVNYEIVVVDQTKHHDASTRGFLNNIKERINYHYTDVKGLTRARNLGAKIAKGDIFVFVDDDTDLPADFLRNHLDAHLQGYDVVSGRVIEEGSALSDQPTWILPWLRFQGGNNCPVDGPTNNITGCNFSVSRKVFEAMGGFDEKFQGRATREDSDFGYGAYRRGFKLWYSSKAQLFHHKIPAGGVKSGVALNPIFDESHHYCEMRFCRKHFFPLVWPFYKWRLKARARREIRALMKRTQLKLRHDGYQ